MDQRYANATLWSTEKQARLRASLTGMWAEDEWLLSGTNDGGKPVQYQLQVVLVNSSLAVEVKYALWYQWTQAGGLQQAPRSQRRLLFRSRNLVAWLNHLALPISSLLERELDFWLCSLRSWLVEAGQYTPAVVRHLNAAQTYVEYHHEDRHLGLLLRIYHTLLEAYDERTGREKDLWDLRTFGVPLNLSHSSHNLNFTTIGQLWLRELAKRYMEYRLATHSPGDCQTKLTAIRRFSGFLTQMAPQTLITGIDRALIVRYLSFLQEEQLPTRARFTYLLGLRSFLETCAHHLHISGLTQEPLIFSEDLPQVPEGGTREIPEEVLVQLRSHLHALPTILLRMVTILLSVGLRINELCQLSVDCLICDDKHEWYLRCYQSKTHRELVVPLVEKEVIAAIQAQQQDIRAQWGKECGYLFPSVQSHVRPYLQSTFRRQLNEWAVRFEIRDQHQCLYRFTAHPFRHSLGMRLINEDVPLEVISRLLGHRSLNMTQVYARVRDKKMRADLERVARSRKTVDYQGKPVKGDLQANDPEVQMTRKGVRGQTLAVGGCARLVVLGDCTYANKCLTCPMWLTSTDDLPALKSVSNRAIRLKHRATACGNQIVVEQQERIIPALALRIKSLEAPEMDGSLCVDDVLAQLRIDLAEAECGREEAQAAGLVLAARHLERAITEMNMRIAALEVADDPMHE